MTKTADDMRANREVRLRVGGMSWRITDLELVRVGDGPHDDQTGEGEYELWLRSGDA